MYSYLIYEKNPWNLFLLLTMNEIVFKSQLQPLCLRNIVKITIFQNNIELVLKKLQEVHVFKKTLLTLNFGFMHYFDTTNLLGENHKKSRVCTKYHTNK